MKATLTFDLPEEKEEHSWALNGSSYHTVLIELDQFLRAEIKYKDQAQWASAEDIRTKLHELLGEHNVSIF